MYRYNENFFFSSDFIDRIENHESGWNVISKEEGNSVLRLNGILVKKRNEISELQSKITRLESQVNNDKSEFTIRNLRIELSEFKQKYENALQQKNVLENKKSQLKNELEELGSEFRKKQESEDVLKKSIKYLEERLNKVLNESVQREYKNHELLLQLSANTHEKVQLKKELMDTKNQYNELKDKLEFGESEILKLKKHLKFYESENEGLKTTIATMIKTLGKKRSKVRDLISDFHLKLSLLSKIFDLSAEEVEIQNTSAETNHDNESDDSESEDESKSDETDLHDDLIDTSAVTNHEDDSDDDSEESDESDSEDVVTLFKK
ncbi:interaptin [Tieghemostelium lacteum]|uniref:Interaptin n=1 Tax=Tieghemostelium lacteum TaxID=361077 RepID=A0A151ZJA6_TIELA|nr:interaptin [Tieghemostelium lacteum]|eukprot:KYQ94081.1 interaptin [Tieghemostelium lacteum]